MAVRNGGLFERHAAGRVGLFIKAVRPKRPSVRSDGLSERLHCLGMKIVLPGCEDRAARVRRLRCSGVKIVLPGCASKC